MLEGRVVIGDCGCWKISGYGVPGIVLRSSVCPKHMGVALDTLENMLYLDKASSVSALKEKEKVRENQLWLT